MSTLKGWAEKHGINATEVDAVLLVTQGPLTAHVAANTDYSWDDDWEREAVTACDLYFRTRIGDGWHRVGTYDAADVRWVLVDAPADNQPQSFKRVCSRCVKRTELATGLNLLSEVS